MRFLTPFLALFLLLAPLASAQQPALQDFDAYVRQALSDWETPGLSVAVVQNGEVVFVEGYGVRQLDGEAVDADTLFAIGSTTKAMVAAAIGALVDDGKVAWDDKVIEHLPELRLSDPWVTNEITLRDLLAHRTGVANADYLWYEQDRGTAEILKCMAGVQLGTSIRSSFIYQNLGYAAAGEVIRRASGKTWDAFLAERFFGPLGMTRTILGPSADDHPNVARPHDRLDGAVTVIENAAVGGAGAAGAIWSSAADMAKWIRFLLAGGVAVDGERLLSEETVAELFTPQTVIRRSNFYPTTELTKPHWITYGLGWFQTDYDGRAVDFHTGSIDGMVAIAGMIRDENLGIYMLANLDHTEVRHALMYRVFDLFSPGDGESRDWSAELLDLYGGLRAQAEERQAEQKAARVEGTSPSLDLASYAGTYRHEVCGTLDVTLDGGTLRATYGGLAGDLEHWNYDTFQLDLDADWRGEFPVTFQLDAAGRPSSVEAAFLGRFERVE